ncbi:MAG: thermonuclease family protein [Candidatus Omnitrophota bacterium]
MIKIILPLLIFLSACTQNYDYSHIKVVRVIDGDTVKLENGESLRYIGLDTPETRIKKGSRFIYAPQPFALEAKKLNQKLVEGKYVRIEFDVEKQDVYKRLLGYCFVGNTFINAKLIEEGFAVTFTIPPNVKYVDTFVALQRSAQETKKGMWGVYETVSAQDSPKYVNQIRTVRGKISTSRQTKKTISLNFDTKGKENVKIIIFENSYDAFRKEGINPLQFYTGKTIEVSGKIRQYKNYIELIVSNPEEISLP